MARFLQQFVHSRYLPRVTLAPGEDTSPPSASSNLPPTHNLRWGPNARFIIYVFIIYLSILST